MCALLWLRLLVYESMKKLAVCLKTVAPVYFLTFYCVDGGLCTVGGRGLSRQEFLHRCAISLWHCIVRDGHGLHLYNGRGGCPLFCACPCVRTGCFCRAVKRLYEATFGIAERSCLRASFSRANAGRSAAPLAARPCRGMQLPCALSFAAFSFTSPCSTRSSTHLASSLSTCSVYLYL